MLFLQGKQNVSTYVLLRKYSDEICNLIFMELCVSILHLEIKLLKISAARNRAALFLQCVL